MGRLKKVIDKKIKQEKNSSKLLPLFKDFMKQSGNEWCGVASEGIEAGDVKSFIDTGSYSLNALVSGKMQGGGFFDNKITVLAGEEATGKTFFIIESIKRWLNDHPTGAIYFFESESAISSDMLKERGVDISRILWMPVTMVQEVRTQALRILNRYLEIPKEKRPPMLFVLDSLGMLSTLKEMTDADEGKEKKDMTRAGLIKALFRILTLKLGRAGVPFLISNHTYEGQGLFATKEQSGGGGIKYASSCTIFLSSRKDKDGTDVIGRIIRCTLKKGRMTKQDKQVEICLNFDSGLHRYYGLLDIGAKQGVFKHVDKQWKIGKQSAKESAIYDNPEKYFTQEVLDKLEIAAGKEFLYGSSLKDVDPAEERKQLVNAG